MSNKPKSILNKTQTDTTVTDKPDTTATTIKPKRIAKSATTGAPKATGATPSFDVKPNDVVPSKAIYNDPAKVLRVVSINVNGLRSAEKKGFFEWLATSDADVVCIQEARITHEQWTDKFHPDGWHTHLFPAEQAGYAGTAIYSRLPFVSATDDDGFVGVTPCL